MFEDLTSFQLYMWISFFVFLLPFTIILTAKLVQYFRRWGETKSTGLEYSNQVVTISFEKITLPINSTIIRSPSSQILKKILLIPPYNVSAKRYLYLATALALNNYEVHLIGSRKNIKKINKEKIDGRIFASEIVNIISPHAVVASDVFFPMLLPGMQQRTKIRFVFIRPILRNRLPSLFSSLFLSIPWISNLFLLPLKPGDDNKFSVSNRVLCIFPKILLKGQLVKKTYANLDIHLIQSRFSFRDKETMVFSRILQFIGESSSSL
ncbi:MAG: hypothetical protein ACTSRE_16730 [Promethearchaeota archaeon]